LFLNENFGMLIVMLIFLSCKDLNPEYLTLSIYFLNQVSYSSPMKFWYVNCYVNFSLLQGFESSIFNFFNLFSQSSELLIPNRTYIYKYFCFKEIRI